MNIYQLLMFIYFFFFLIISSITSLGQFPSTIQGSVGIISPLIKRETERLIHQEDIE